MNTRSLSLLTLCAAQVSCLALLPGLCRAQLSRTDDQYVLPPEYRPAKKHSLDITAGSSYMSGNVDSLAVNGGLHYTLEMSRRNSVFLDGDGMLTKFNRQTLLDKRRATALYIFSAKPAMNIYAWTSYGHNRFLELDRRTTSGAGLCFHNFMPSVFSQFLVSAGPAYEYARYYDREEKRFLRANGRLNFMIPAGSFATIGEDFIYFGDTKNFGDYHFYNELYLQLTIKPDTLSYRLALVDEYENRPFAGVRSNDFSMTQGLVLHLGK